MKCFKCGNTIEATEKKFMYGLDRPYINLFFHFDCWREISSTYDVYLAQNVELVYNYIEKQKKSGKNGRK